MAPPTPGEVDAAIPTTQPQTEDAGSNVGGTVGRLFSEDFEGSELGQQPADWDNFLGWVANSQNPANDREYAVVDDQHAHAGSRSLHVRGGANPAQLTHPLPPGTDRVYVRAWLRMTRQLGQNPGANHETLFALRRLAGAAHEEVRFGEIKGVIGTNEVPSDNIAPRMDQWGGGPVVPANTWVCLEVAFLADAEPHRVLAWADGREIHRIDAPQQDFQNGPMPDDWLAGFFNELVIGWHSFSNAEQELWLDDLVVATDPIGCGR